MQKFSRLKRPVFITETGIPDAKDHIRAEWAEAYFKAVRNQICNHHVYSVSLGVAHHHCSCNSTVNNSRQVKHFGKR